LRPRRKVISQLPRALLFALPDSTPDAKHTSTDAYLIEKLKAPKR